MPYTFKHGDRPLDGVTVQRAVGRGGFGEVYYALTDSGKQIALKYLRENPEVELRGISHVMNLKSPHLITIYDVRSGTEGEPFVLMEYVSGPSLRELMLAEPGGLGPQKAAFFVDGVAKGLAYLHERGIVHRDLKPANIFYDDGYVKIGDYGLSKHMSVSKHSGQTVSVGTVHYMAPEIGSGSYSKAIDIYALGVILFELLTGNLPFTGSSMGEILMRHLSDRPDLSGIPEPFASVISKALAKDPKDRYQDADEMIDALRQVGEVSDSIASFDPATLTRGPRVPEAMDPERTMTTPPRVPPPPPPLDARASFGTEGASERLIRRLRDKADQVARRVEEKLDRRERKRVEKARAKEVAARTGRRGQFFILIAVAAAVGIGLSLLGSPERREERAVALVFTILAGTFGPLLAYFKFLLRSPARSRMWDRLTYVGVTVLFMIPAFGVASESGEGMMGATFAPLAAIFLCDWTSRIEAGRRGQVNGGAAFWAGLVGLIAASFAGSHTYYVAAACVCATMSLLAQAGASMWPVVPGSAPRWQAGGRRGPRAAAWAAHIGGHHAAAAGVEHGHHAAPATERHAAVGDSAGVGQTASLEPRNPAVRAVFGVLCTLLMVGSLGAFFVLVITTPSCADDCSGLLFGTLSGVACLPFLLSKALHRYKMPLWRGTLRMLIVSLSLLLASGMIAIISFQPMPDDELGAAIFGLVVGGATAVVALCIPGRKWRGQPAVRTATGVDVAHTPPPLPAATRRMDEVTTPPDESRADEVDTAFRPSAPVVIDAASPSFVGRAANAGMLFFGKLFLLIGVVLALSYGALPKRVLNSLDDNNIHVSDEAREVITDGIPAPLLLGVAAAGCALLLFARRRGGGMHMLRGCLGCALGLGAVVGALGPAAGEWETLLSSSDWTTLDWDEIAQPLLATAIPLVAAFVLLSWPGRRQDKAVVV